MEEERIAPASPSIRVVSPATLDTGVAWSLRRRQTGHAVSWQSKTSDSPMYQQRRMSGNGVYWGNQEESKRGNTKTNTLKENKKRCVGRGEPTRKQTEKDTKWSQSTQRKIRRRKHQQICRYPKYAWGAGEDWVEGVQAN